MTDLFANGHTGHTNGTSEALPKFYYPDIGSKWVPRSLSRRGNMPMVPVEVTEHIPDLMRDGKNTGPGIRISRGEGHPKTAYRVDVFLAQFVEFDGTNMPVATSKPTAEVPVATYGSLSPALIGRLEKLARKQEQQIRDTVGLRARVSIEDVLESMLEAEENSK